MTRLDPAALSVRSLRALIGIGAAVVLAVAASGCATSASPEPTPDPFTGLADRSDQAFRQGLESYGQGQYRDALTSFEQARLLSPTVELRIDQMIERSKVALAPPTPMPPTATALPITPIATQVPRSARQPDTELGKRYFGNVTLGLVPGRESDITAATQFYFRDQIGLQIEALKQHGKLPFSVRVFNADSGSLIADIQSEDAAATPQAALAATPPTFGMLNPDVPAAATAAPAAFHLVRFLDTFVWYHSGGDEPGHYALELSANGLLTNTFDYSVGSVPLPTPTPVVVAEPTAQATPEPVPSLAAPVDVPNPVAAPPSSQSAVSQPPVPVAAAPAEAAVVAPTSVPEPTPTIVPTPGNAYATAVGGVPAGLDVDSSRARFYLADASGVIWATDALGGQQRPTLDTPIHIGARQPVDLAADSTTGYLYLSTRTCAPAAPGCILVVDPAPRPNGETVIVKSIPLRAAPGDLKLDADFGLLYVVLPQLQAIAMVDVRFGKVVQLIEQVPQVTSLALDPVRHTLYAAHLAGQVTVIDTLSGRVTARVAVTGAGLASVATARGLGFAVNTVTHELAVLESISQQVERFPLSEEPAAVAAAEDSGAVYVLASRSSSILRIDPTDGSEVGKVIILNRSGHASILPNDIQALRPRLVLNPANDSLFVTLPEAGTLATVTDSAFPVLARSIPLPDLSDIAVAAPIPDVLRPGGGSADLTSALGH